MLKLVSSQLTTLCPKHAEIYGDLRAWHLALFCGQAAGAALLCATPDTASTDTNRVIPKWHGAAAYAGFCAAVGWIYLAAGEVVSALKALGAASGASDAILGLTVLAWGNSVGDLAADVAVRKVPVQKVIFAKFQSWLTY